MTLRVEAEGKRKGKVGVALPKRVRVESTISGVCFHDSNANGQRERNEARKSGRVVCEVKQLGRQWEVLEGMTADSKGRYQFAVDEVGSYRVFEVLQPGWVQTSPWPTLDGSAYYEINITSLGDSYRQKDFGSVRRVKRTPVAIAYWRNHLEQILVNWDVWKGPVRSSEAFSDMDENPAAAVMNAYTALSNTGEGGRREMVRAQLLGVVLNVASGHVGAEVMVYLGDVRGAPALFGADFMTVGNLVGTVDRNVFGSKNWNLGWMQDLPRQVLESVNENRSFVG